MIPPLASHWPRRIHHSRCARYFAIGVRGLEALLVAEASLLPGERIGAQLQAHHLARHAFAALQMKRRARAVGGPESTSFPPCARIIDPPIQGLGEEAH